MTRSPQPHTEFNVGGPTITQQSGDPVPSIAEADATGEIAELYADIRQSLGMPFVNLVWRNLASVPGGLKWAWTTMKPLYQQGAVYVEARQLRDSQMLPTVPRLPRAVLRAVGVDASAEVSIQAAIDGYDRGNPLNIVTFSALMSRLRGEQPTAPPPSPVDAGPEPPGPVETPKMPNVGRGIAMGERPVAGGESHASVTLSQDGAVTVHTSIFEPGTGTYTLLRQIVSEELGIPAEDIQVEVCDTDGVPFDTGVGGSRG